MWRCPAETITACEVGRQRIQVCSLLLIPKTLGVAVEEIVGEEPKAAAKSGPALKLQQQMDRIEKLPEAQQRFVTQVIDSVIAQASRQGKSGNAKPGAKQGLGKCCFVYIANQSNPTRLISDCIDFR